jgi:hypothetical protein
MCVSPYVGGASRIVGPQALLGVEWEYKYCTLGSIPKSASGLVVFVLLFSRLLSHPAEAHPTTKTNQRLLVRRIYVVQAASSESKPRTTRNTTYYVRNSTYQYYYGVRSTTGR